MAQIRQLQFSDRRYGGVAGRVDAFQGRAAAAKVARVQQQIVNLCADPDCLGALKAGSVRNRDVVVLAGPTTH